MSTVAAVPLLLGTPAFAQMVPGQGPGAYNYGGVDWRDALPSDPSDDQTAQGGPGGGSFEGSILIPGTNTSMRIGGYAKLDMYKDWGRNPGDFILINKIPPAGGPGAVPGQNRTGDVRLHARQSRLDIETRTPTAFGELKVYFEGDFYGGNPAGTSDVVNQSNLGVRHFYGQLGPLLAGQFWSLAMDLDSAPETLDFGGPPGFVFIRQGQIRWTQDMGNGFSLAGAIESPSSDFTGNTASNNSVPFNMAGGAPAFASSTVSSNALSQIPDLIARASYRQSFGEISAYALFRKIEANTGVDSQAAHAFGWQTGLAGKQNIYGKDNVTYELNVSKGGGRYINNLNGQGAAWNGAGGMVALRTYGAYVYYQHWWTANLRTNIGAGTTRVYNENFVDGVNMNIAANNQTAQTYGGHINLIWSPVPNTNFGVEWAEMKRSLEVPNTARVHRLQFSAQFLF